MREQQPAATNPLAVFALEDHVVPGCDRADERRERLEGLGERVALGAHGAVLKVRRRVTLSTKGANLELQRSQRALGVALRRAKRAQRSARRICPLAAGRMRGYREHARGSVLHCQHAQPPIRSKVLQCEACALAGDEKRVGVRWAKEIDQHRQRARVDDEQLGWRVEREPPDRTCCVRFALLGARAQQCHERYQCAGADY
mmetsp:Transcript_47143/g.110027  ORF Transcript_47143/g.110027 Transcript_47143/m.110027 type:complete len:201 (-) Transcript_47143:389-991(-)